MRFHKNNFFLIIYIIFVVFGGKTLKKYLILFLALFNLVCAEELFKITENNVTIIENENFDIKEYIEISDPDVRIIAFNASDTEVNTVGSHTYNLLAINKDGEIETKTFEYEVISESEWNDYVLSISRFATLKSNENNRLLEEKGHADKNAIELAKSFIGMEGSCDKVAQAFINKYFGEGYSIYNTEDISVEEALPGDIIFYKDGGVGLQHWAVYLGGNSALQGNINGTTVIGSVYMNYGSTPNFRRIKSS